MKLKIYITLLVLIPVISCNAELQNNQNEPDSKRTNFCNTSLKTPISTKAYDLEIFNKVVKYGSENFYNQTPAPDIITYLSKFFLNTPYVAHTLEIPGDEQLVVNLREMDCTTFVEYVVAFTLLLKENRTDFERFIQLLACIRYRNGIIDGYPSRLHYFTEWLHNNAEKGILEIVSNQLSDKPYVTNVFFMSSNPGLYRQLENPDYVSRIKETETVISEFEMNYIPKDRIVEYENQIKEGDIIAFTTNIAGLDVSHTGFAVHRNGRLHLLHASTRTNQIEISPVPLSEYLAPMSRVTGIIVGRLTMPG